MANLTEHKMNHNQSKDLIICSLQHWLDKAEKILNDIDSESNPAYLTNKVDTYFKEQQKDWEAVNDRSNS